MTVSEFYVLGGTLPRDSRSYVARSADDDLLDGLRRGQFCYVLTSRQMGKSSLMVRTATRLRQERVTCIVLDLTSVGQNLTDEQWYDGLLNSVAAQADLEDELDEFWLSHKRLGPLQRWMQALKSVVLARIPGRIVLFIDEIDAVRSLPFSADELFAAIRECHNRRTEDPDFQRITFCLLGVATPADLIRDTRSTPFNIGRRIELTDFTEAEARPLGEGLCPQITQIDANGEVESTDFTDWHRLEEASRKAIRPVGDAKTQRGEWAGARQLAAGCVKDGLDRKSNRPKGTRNPKLLDRVLYWTGGHPYLTQRLCRAVAEEIENRNDHAHAGGAAEMENSDVDQICGELFLASGARNRDDNLLFVRERLLRSEVDRAGLLDIYDKIRAGRRVKDDETSPVLSVLRLAGIVRTEGAYLRVRNRIYAQVFDRDWVRANMPDAELRRQEMAFKRGFARAAALSAAVVIVTGGLALTAIRETALARKNALMAAEQRALAQQQAQAAERALYAADMGLAQQAWSDRNYARVGELLRETRPAPGQADARGFEWGLLQRRGHFDLPFVRDPSSYAIRQIAFSSDGRYVRTNNGHGKVSYWDAVTGAVDPKQTNVPLAKLATNVSPDGTISVEGKNYAEEEPEYHRSTVTLRDRRTGRALHTLKGAMLPAVFSPDGRLLATEIPRGVALWNTASGARLQTFSLCSAPFAFAPNGRTLAAESFSYGWGVKIFDISASREPRVIAGSADTATNSPDGSLLFTMDANWDGVTIRDAATLRPMRTLAHATHPMTCLYDGRTVATALRGANGTVILWDMTRGVETGRLSIPTFDIAGMAAQPGGPLLAIGSFDAGIRVWDTTTRREVRGYPTAAGMPAFSSDGKMLAVREPAAVALYDAVTGRRLREFPGANLPIAFSPTGPEVATGGPGSSLVLWDSASGARLRTFKAQRFPAHACAFSPDGQRLAAGDAGEYNVVMWDTTTGRETFHIPGKTDRTDVASYSLFFSPNGRRLYSGNQNGTITVWEADAIR